MPSYECHLCEDTPVFKNFAELAEHATTVHYASVGRTAVFEERWILFENDNKSIETTHFLVSVELVAMETSTRGCSVAGKDFAACADCKYEFESGGCVASRHTTGRVVTYNNEDLK